MGEVYRARDSRLNRDVAIKVLREEGASNPERRSRFEREARAVAALNHPNIVAVYDFGIEGDKQFIVSELVEGESLRSLVSKPVAVRKLMEIATEVADGLSAAHAARVVRRDLKPENIMIGKDGRVKILDFGLFRQSHPDRRAGTGIDPDETFVHDIDATRNLTEEGMVHRTASYMSPEQATGRAVDRRSDQFSLGLVLHEMATGKQRSHGPVGLKRWRPSCGTSLLRSRRSCLRPSGGPLTAACRRSRSSAMSRLAISFRT